MELREFVKESLTEILGGIREAQDAIASLQGRHGVINPTWNDMADLADHVQVVKFDVAVAASDQSTKGGKGGIKVMSFELGAKVENQEQNRTVSRVSFSVPIVPPTTIIEGVKKPERQPAKRKRA